MLPAAGMVDLADGGAVLDVAEVQSGVQEAFGAPFGCAQVAELLNCGSEAGQRQCFSPASWHCSHPALLLGSSFLLCLFFHSFPRTLWQMPHGEGFEQQALAQAVCPCAGASAHPPVPPYPGRDTFRGIFPH